MTSIPKLAVRAIAGALLLASASAASAHVFSDRPMSDLTAMSMASPWGWGRAERAALPLFASPVPAAPMLFGGALGWSPFAGALAWTPHSPVIAWPLFGVASPWSLLVPVAPVFVGWSAPLPRWMTTDLLAMPSFTQSLDADATSATLSVSRSVSGTVTSYWPGINGVATPVVHSYSVAETWSASWSVGPVTPVPEPAAIGMLALGLAGAGWWARRRARASA